MGGGKLVAGAPHAPFSGALSLLLTGDEITESPQCGGLKGRSLDVEAGGELLLHGKPTHHNLRPLPMKASCTQAAVPSCNQAAAPCA